MARYEVTHSCGHVAYHNLIGPRNYREYRLRRLGEELCPECQEAERQRRNEESARRNQEEGLPALVGTEKQVSWAESIRRDIMDGLARFLDDEEHGEDVARLIEHLSTETRASWWIDHRDMAALKHPLANRFNLETWIERMERAGILSQPLPVSPSVPDEARVEATVRPVEPKTETVAEIKAVGTIIEVHFPEVREDFRKLIRYELGYSWSGSCWRRGINTVAGPVEERVVETAHRLLAAGFPIRLYDEELRRRVLEANFRPETKRIIWKHTSGQYAGWFGIEWPRDEDYYAAARKLPGARWDRDTRRVVVPAEQWEAVIGFAETYDFTLSPGARELVEQARAAQEAALVAPPMEPKRAPKGRKPSQRPPELEVPAEVTIDDSLRDDD